MGNIKIRKVEGDRLEAGAVSDLSESLRTELTIIRGYIEILLTNNNKNLKDKQIEYLQIVLKSEKRIEKIIKELENKVI
ncbi:MAG: hypothetical protein GF317_06030 [Candidatus Lokiarchaeota archaeon]|nr:hypothetical protein [Candidatus Lokiarchaeota archaeon]